MKATRTALAAMLGVVVLVPSLGTGPAQAEVPDRVVTLTAADRVAGAPAPGSAPTQQLLDATVEIDLERGNVLVEAHLAGPGGVHYPWFQVEPGTWDGSTCRAIPGAGSIGDGFDDEGRALEYSYSLPAGFAEATCVVAFSFDDPVSLQAYDALAGPIADKVEVPVLSIEGAELLGSKKIRLVRGVWTPVDVDVSNAGEGSPDVTVTGKGKGLKVRRGTITELSAIGGEPYALSTTVMVKLTGRSKRTKLTLRATASGVDATRAVKVRTVKAPARPRPGRYAGGGATFTVTGGKVAKVKGFRIRTTTSCSSSAYDTTNTYDFPTTPISRAGIVHARDSRSGEAGYTVGLEMLVAGKKATRGVFFYSGPAGCFARAAVKAKRVGR